MCSIIKVLAGILLSGHVPYNPLKEDFFGFELKKQCPLKVYHTILGEKMDDSFNQHSQMIYQFAISRPTLLIHFIFKIKRILR